jgi:hypothetical protein
MQSNQGHKRKRTEVEVVVCPSAFPDFTTVGGSTSRRREKLRNDNDSRRGGRSGDGMRYNNKNKDDGRPPALDVQETIREVHKFGATGFTDKQQKKAHKNDEYEKLTGRTVKRQKIPTKILVGMRKKAMKREEREKREMRESGVVSHTTSGTSSSLTNKKKKRDNKRDKKSSDNVGVGPRGVFGSNRARNKGERRKMSSRSFGPSPDVGFMLKGVLKVKNPSSR